MSSVNFNRAADFYDETRGFPPGEETHIAALFARTGNLTASSRVLEIGVGTGRIALPLAGLVGEVVGVDLSRAMLNRLRAKRTHEPVQPIEGDVTRLPLASGTFDAVTATHIFHLVPEWRMALDEAGRVMKPGAMLLLGNNEDDRKESGLSPLWQAWDEAADSERHRVGVPFNRLNTFLEDVEWRLVGEKQVYDYPLHHTAAQFLDRLERRVWSRLWSMSDETIEKGIAAVKAAVEEHGIDLYEPVKLMGHFIIRAYLPPDR